MAEHKIFRCDRCNIIDAIHLVFENVDEYGPDPADGKYQNVSGDVDLCIKCLSKSFTKVMNLLNREEQRKLWKAFLGKF